MFWIDLVKFMSKGKKKNKKKGQKKGKKDKKMKMAKKQKRMKEDIENAQSYDVLVSEKRK